MSKPKKSITVNPFSMSSVRKAQNWLRRYEDKLPAKCEKFIVELAKRGIRVGKRNLGGYKDYIVFGTEVEPTTCGAKGIMYATNTGLIHAQWIGAGVSYGEADVSPLLMAEFGSGLRAEKNPRGPEFGMGTGTFPGQTHAFDPDGWWYMDLEGEWHHSYGVTPTMPMEAARNEMLDQIVTVAKKVFK